MDIVELSEAILENDDVHTHLSAYISDIKSLPAATIVRATSEIRTAGNLCPRWHAREAFRPSLLERFWPSLRKARYPTRKAELGALKKYPALSHLYTFHGDGWLREEALKCLNEPPDNPFEFAALIYRLNDWVGQVRDAAYDCASRLFPQTSAHIIAEASLFLFTEVQKFGRCGDKERHIIESALYRRDVMQALADVFMQRPTGRIGTVLRHALRQPLLDAELPQLAREAALSQVRVVALETLIMRKARWPAGYGYEWVDKRYGLRRRVPRFDQRPVEHQLDIEDLLARGSQDCAVVVRKVVGQGLIDRQRDLSPAMNRVGRLLSEDKALSVRSRAEFFLKNVPND